MMKNLKVTIERYIGRKTFCKKENIQFKEMMQAVFYKSSTNVKAETL